MQPGARILHIESETQNSSYVDKFSFHAWYGMMVQFLQSIPEYNSTLIDGRYPPPDLFYPYLEAFLNSSSGRFFRGNILFSEDNKAITATRFLPLGLSQVDLSQQIDMISNLYEMSDKAAPLQVFPYDPSWSFFMTFPAIQASSHIYLILAFGAFLSESSGVSPSGGTPSLSCDGSICIYCDFHIYGRRLVLHRARQFCFGPPRGESSFPPCLCLAADSPVLAHS